MTRCLGIRRLGPNSLGRLGLSTFVVGLAVSSSSSAEIRGSAIFNHRPMHTVSSGLAQLRTQQLRQRAAIGKKPIAPELILTVPSFKTIVGKQVRITPSASGVTSADREAFSRMIEHMVVPLPTTLGINQPQKMAGTKQEAIDLIDSTFEEIADQFPPKARQWMRDIYWQPEKHIRTLRAGRNKTAAATIMKVGDEFVPIVRLGTDVRKTEIRQRLTLVHELVHIGHLLDFADRYGHDPLEEGSAEDGFVEATEMVAELLGWRLSSLISPRVIYDDIGGGGALFDSFVGGRIEELGDALRLGWRKRERIDSSMVRALLVKAGLLESSFQPNHVSFGRHHSAPALDPSNIRRELTAGRIGSLDLLVPLEPALGK